MSAPEKAGREARLEAAIANAAEIFAANTRERLARATQAPYGTVKQILKTAFIGFGAHVAEMVERNGNR